MSPKLLVLFLVLVNGCMLNNLSPSKKFNESVRKMNDASRWGRIDLALQFIHPAYQERFAQSRYRWGQEFRIADTELVRVEMSPDKDKAVSIMSISWYQTSHMTLHNTVLRQVWTEHEGNYIMSSEDVFDGDPTLIGGEIQAQHDEG